MVLRFQAVIITLFGLAGPAFGSPIKVVPGSGADTARKALGNRLPTAKLLWERAGRIFYSPLKGFEPQVLTPSGEEEHGPRWSPDGSKMLFVRAGKGVMTMQVDIHASSLGGMFKRNTEKVVLSQASTASWTRDGKSITAIASNNYEVLKYDLASNAKNTIYDPRHAKWAGKDSYMQEIAQAAELRTGGSRFLLTYRRYDYSGDPQNPQGTDHHITEIVDLQNNKIYSNTDMERGDCSPSWAPDGSFITNTARCPMPGSGCAEHGNHPESRPVLKVTFNPSAPSVAELSSYWVGPASTAKFGCWDHRLSNDGKQLSFDCKFYTGSKDLEIYVWTASGTKGAPVRVTFDTDDDLHPDLLIPPGCTFSNDCDQRTCFTRGCNSGKCTYTPIPDCCTKPSQCDDKDDCTTNTCNNDHKCAFPPISGCCTEEGPCKDDGILCTADTCDTDNRKCVHPPIPNCCTNDEDCEDTANPCAEGSCNKDTGECSSVWTPGCCVVDVNCDDDEKICTQTTCDENENICRHPPIAGCCTKPEDCDDENPCTDDVCADNECDNPPIADCCRDDGGCGDTAAADAGLPGPDAGLKTRSAPPSSNNSAPPAENTTERRTLTGGCTVTAETAAAPWVAATLWALVLLGLMSKRRRNHFQIRSRLVADGCPRTDVAEAPFAVGASRVTRRVSQLSVRSHNDPG